MLETATIDALTADQLHAMGSLKWSTHPDSLPAWVAESDFGCAPPILRALHEAVDSQNFGYLPPAVAKAMSEATAEWLQRSFGWSVDPAAVRPTADVLTTYSYILEHLMSSDDAVIVPTPSYTPFLSIAAQRDRRVIELPLDVVDGRWIIDPERLDEVFRAGGRVLVLCDPHNPTGSVCTREELVEIGTVVERHGGRVFADAIHAPIVYAPHSFVPYASVNSTTAAHTITAVSATKGWNLAGLKAAQIVFSNPEDLAEWSGGGQHFEVGASTFGMIANTAAYTAGGRWLESVLGYLRGTSAHIAGRVAAELPGASMPLPQGTYFAWLDLRYAGLGARTAAHLRDVAGVSLTDGSLSGAGYDGYVRFNFATPLPIVDAMLDRIAAAVAR